MSRKRFYVPRDSIQESIAILPPDQAHHLRNVLRIKSGESVEIFDGKGNGYIGEVDLRGSKVLVSGLRGVGGPEPSLRLILAAALIKSTKFEWMLQKATELGIDEFIPLYTLRSDIRIPEIKMPARMKRWNRIVFEAARQCGRCTAPAIRAPMEFSILLDPAGPHPHEKLMFCEKASEPLLLDPAELSNPVVLCIGPEGGWEISEIDCAHKAGCRIFSLGPWTLRAETAAIAAVSIVQHQITLSMAQH
jgi:16S rRNA (uracil1498-N3)-methyltransferase